jgi:hypothetical protein
MWEVRNDEHDVERAKFFNRLNNEKLLQLKRQARFQSHGGGKESLRAVFSKRFSYN